MPRITAETVAEHVANQRAAVLDAAIRLFTTRGYHDVGLGDIAAEVGLARNSLYRYVPDKSHLLLEWYRRVVPRHVERWRAVTDGDDDPAIRLQRWARAYLEWADSPEHRLVAPLTDIIDTLDDDTRTEIAALHRSMMDIVAAIVRDARVPDPQVSGVVDLLTGLVLGTARAEAARGPDPATRHRLDTAITAIIAAAPEDGPAGA